MILHEEIDDAIGEAPPSTVDVDLIMNQQRRRMAVARWGGAGLAAATTIVLVAAGIGFAGSVRGDLNHPASPPGSETHEAARQRLDRALFDDLRQVAPELRWITVTANEATGYTRYDRGEVWLSEWVPGDGHTTYLGQGAISSGGRTGTVLINISYGRPPICVKTTETQCTVEPRPNGEFVETTVTHYSNTDPAQIELTVSFVNADGLVVMVENRNQSGVTENDPATGAEPPLTASQLRQIALDPRLTLPASFS
jgi:hypothetical protein